MGRSAKSASKRCQGALLAAAVTAMPLLAGLPALASAPEAAAELPGQLGVVTLALYPGRNSDDHGGIMCTGTRTCEPIRYPYLVRRAGADDLQNAIGEDAAGGPLVAFGYSQGARVVGRWLEQHAGTEGAPSPDQLSFLLIGNPGRKYGGGHVRLGEVTPETEYEVIDVSRQYDRASDWPDHPMNLLAFLNASAGLANIHINYDEVDIYDPANYVWREGNTTYVFIPTENIPLLEPLRKLGLTELADKLNGPLKERIEKAYDRSYLPDQPGWPVEPEPEPEVPQQDPVPVESGSTTLAAASTLRTSASDEPQIEEQSAGVHEKGALDPKDAGFDAEDDRDAQDEADLTTDTPIDDPADDDVAGADSGTNTSDEDAADNENNDDADKEDASDKQEAATSSTRSPSPTKDGDSSAGEK